MNKNILIAILIVIIIGAGAALMFSSQQADKIDTEFYLLTDNTLDNGDQIVFQLKEVNGSSIAGETVVIGFTDDNGKVETFEVVTDSDGKAALTLQNENSGSHELTLAYNGNDKYKECALKVSIIVEDDSDDSDSDDSSTTVSDSNSVSSDDSSSNNTLPDKPEVWYYDNETGEYYNDDGIIVGDSQQAGGNIWEWKKQWEEGGGDPYKDIS